LCFEATRVVASPIGRTTSIPSSSAALITNETKASSVPGDG
jgi:hypothetical protein